MANRFMNAYETSLRLQHEEESAAIGVGYADAEVIRARAAVRAGEPDATSRLTEALADRKSARASMMRVIIQYDAAVAEFKAIERELDEQRAKRQAAKARKAALST
jgi:hypothetical protein